MRHLLWLLLVVWTVGSAAPVVYVDDSQRVGVRQDAHSTAPPIEVVTTGDKLTVLDANDGYLKVRTPKGTEGWVNSRYVTKAPPARLRIGPLQAEYERLRSAQAGLKKALDTARAEAARLKGEAAALRAHNRELTQRLTRRRREGWLYNSWLYAAGAMVLLFVLGLIVGMRHDRQRIARRLGGMEL